MTEKDLQRCVMQLAKLCQWRVFHTWISIRSNPGFPDIIAVRGERLLAIELKSERGKLSEAQVAWINDLAAAGVDCHIWRPREWYDGTAERVLR